MALLQHLCGALLFAHLAHLAPLSQFLCRDQACYSISWATKSFSGASRACSKIHGHLMTVKNTVQADAIAVLMDNVEKDHAAVWIGLQQPEKERCTDPLQPLRGFSWVTGDSDTDYTNWSTEEEQKCGALCVSVRKDGTWGEADCTQKVDGYLCELSYSSSCNPLLLPPDFNVIYYHNEFGFANRDGSVYPPDTRVNTSRDLFCEDKGDGTGAWSSDSPGAWNCLIENGGCEHECEDISGSPECKCPPGSQLTEDKRTCTKPCDPNPCSQICDPISDSPGFLCMCSEGYNLSGDGKTCEDIDDCALNPNVCEQHCTNTIGGFECGCKPGFEKVDEKCQDTNECLDAMCEQDCDNYPGGYKCVCNEGFIIDQNKPKKCKRICNTSRCEAECDVKERHKCQCPEGYVLEDNESGGFICTAIEVCVEEPCILCTMIQGRRQCACPEGYVVQNNSCIPDEGWDEVETPSGILPSHSFGLQPPILLGIFIAVISMITVLITFVCLIVRRHYMEKHSMDYKYKNMEDTVVLQYVKIDPWSKL